jgi:hypothetical protein
MGNFLGIIGLLFLGFTLLGKCSSDNSSDKEVPIANDKTKQQIWIITGEDKIRSLLKDGDSAKFKGSYFKMAELEGKSIPVSCGQVNSKNSFGAYSGFQRYVAAGDYIALLEEQVSDFAVAWDKLCK